MARRVDYRKLALENYRRQCVYCGFGIEAVLEVAHLDCDRSNCALENLAVLCPMCHRMHDLGLIPTEFLVHRCDNPPALDWGRLRKDGPRKAAETLRRRRAARKAVETRRLRQNQDT